MSNIAQILGDELAEDTIKYILETGDEDVITEIAKAIGDSSQTLQEAFITSVRIRRAAIRARSVLEEKLGKAKPQPKAKPKPKQAAAPWDLED